MGPQNQAGGLRASSLLLLPLPKETCGWECKEGGLTQSCGQMASSSSESTHHQTLEHSWSCPLVVSHSSIAPYHHGILPTVANVPMQLFPSYVFCGLSTLQGWFDPRTLVSLFGLLSDHRPSEDAN